MNTLRTQPHDKRKAITRGALVGFGASVVLFVLLVTLNALVDGFTDSNAERAVSLLVIGCYVLAGFSAVRSARDSGAAIGAYAGVGAASFGLLLSAVVWAVRGGPFLAHDTGGHPAAAVVGPLLFGAAFGWLGGLWGDRREAKS